MQTHTNRMWFLRFGSYGIGWIPAYAGMTMGKLAVFTYLAGILVDCYTF
jgi:hypothetical protein